MRLIGNKMNNGEATLCYCQSCGSCCGQEFFTPGKDGPFFSSLSPERIYSRVIFGVHPEVHQKQVVPVCLEVVYFCNFCEWRTTNGPDEVMEIVIKLAVVNEKIGRVEQWRADFIPDLGCWITFSRVIRGKDKCKFNYQMNVAQLGDVLVALKELEGNPFKFKFQ
ncbi:MAG: hypothetical protein WC587_00310 [Candidatus Paceibacterota bacterium]